MWKQKKRQLQLWSPIITQLSPTPKLATLSITAKPSNSGAVAERLPHLSPRPPTLHHVLEVPKTPFEWGTPGPFPLPPSPQRLGLPQSTLLLFFPSLSQEFPAPASPSSTYPPRPPFSADRFLEPSSLCLHFPPGTLPSFFFAPPQESSPVSPRYFSPWNKPSTIAPSASLLLEDSSLSQLSPPAPPHLPRILRAPLPWDPGH